MKQTSHPFSTDHFLHGGDYNPDQWLDRPDILEKDLEYFEKAGINCVSLGIFSWAMLEPEEGHYQFDWMKEIIDRALQPWRIHRPGHSVRSTSSLAGRRLPGSPAGG